MLLPNAIERKNSHICAWICVDPGAVSATFGCRRPQAAQPLGMVHHHRNARARKDTFHHLHFTRELSSIHRFLHAIVLEVQIHGLTGGLSCVDPGAVSAAFGCRRPQAAQPLGMVHHHRKARARKDTFHHLRFTRELSSIHRFLHAIVLEVQIPLRYAALAFSRRSTILTS
ncbi:unnamed protein product [Darwinula stevensoni]|uniref:Uncharacterized protein n=1 Tax=Darwinula stevensoni TaxID=69355 RepID=A0A7R8X742_9CRUS|nr:unnamed protein product [Darwinula stevensoni]CAG0882165.1 unnamed protein product [Darwinula stevensoni]